MANRDSTKNTQSNDAVRQNLTKEMIIELEETFKMVSDVNGKMPASKLGLVLKALGMSGNDAVDVNKYQNEGIELDAFFQIVVDCTKYANWAAHEMNESFAIFDKDGNGFVDPSELRRVFTRVGETLTETELEDQLREFDIDGDLQMVIAEYYKMIAGTKGSDYVFDDSHH